MSRDAPDPSRRAAVLASIAAGAALAAPALGRAGWPALASSAAVVAALAGLGGFAVALWATARRRAPGGVA